MRKAVIFIADTLFLKKTCDSVSRFVINVTSKSKKVNIFPNAKFSSLICPLNLYQVIFVSN